MTAPISFPTIQPPQLAAPRRSSVDGLAELLVGIAQHRQTLALQRQQLDLERQRTEDQLANSSENRAASAQERKQRQQEFDQKQQSLAAADLAETEVANMLSSGGVTPEKLNAARMILLERAKGQKLPAPVVLAALDNAIQRNEKTFTEIAQRKTADIQADVAGATKENVIKASNVALERAGVELRTAKIQEHLAQVTQQYGEARGALATSVLAGGGTLGQAYRIIGVKIPAGVDPNWTTAKGQGSTEQQRKLEGTAGLVTLGNSWIEAAGDPDISRFGAIIRRGGTIGGTLEILGSSKLDPAERQAIAGYRMLGEGFALYVTGQQASAGQVDRLVGVISKQPGEVGKSAETRALLRHAVVDLIQNAANGGSPADGMTRIVELAKSRGADARTIATLKAFTQDAQRYESTRRAKGGAAAPADAVVDPAVARRFGPPK